MGAIDGVYRADKGLYEKLARMLLFYEANRSIFAELRAVKIRMKELVNYKTGPEYYNLKSRMDILNAEINAKYEEELSGYVTRLELGALPVWLDMNPPATCIRADLQMVL